MRGAVATGDVPDDEADGLAEPEPAAAPVPPPVLVLLLDPDPGVPAVECAPCDPQAATSAAVNAPPQVTAATVRARLAARA
jgi:hypothetical protein